MSANKGSADKNSENSHGNYISRRSVLGRLTSATFALAGVRFSIAPVMVRSAPGYGQPGPECGNAGVICTDACKNSGNGISKRSAWQRCCEISSGNWDCCSYWDYCTANSLNPAQTACGSGVGPMLWWCGDKTSNYVCTETICDKAGHANEAACQSNCHLTGQAQGTDYCNMANAPR